MDGRQEESEKDAERLLQEAIDGGERCEVFREANVGVTQSSAVVSSFNYDELDGDDTLLFASEWNLVTEDFGDEEDVLVVSQPTSADGERPADGGEATAIRQRPQHRLRYPLERSVPMISSEDDATLVPDSSENTIDQSLVEDAYLSILDLNTDDDEEGEDEENVRGEVKQAGTLIVDEAELSRRYLTINSAPLYRWSEGMLPSLPMQQQEQPTKKSVPGAGNDYHDGPSSESLRQVEEKKMYLDSVINGPSIPAIREGVRPEIAHPNSLKSPWIVERLKHLAKAYNDRTTFVKKAIENLSASDESSSSESESDSRSLRGHKDYFTFESIFGDEWDCQDRHYNAMLHKCTLLRQGCTSESPLWYRAWISFTIFLYRLWCTVSGVYEPQSILYVTWLLILASAFSYNAIFILFRAVFPYESLSGTLVFFILDTVFDIIYLLDIFWFKPHLKFIKDGQWMDDPTATRLHYLSLSRFRTDLSSILPIDYLLWVYLGGYNVSPSIQRLSRLNRMLKIASFWEFFARIDAITTKFPYLFRIVHTLCYKMYIIHLGTCTFYLSSAYEGFGATPWTFDGEGNAYLRCFYFAFRTTTSIGGRLPKPNNLFERAYMTVAWLLGVFVFAMVIGQIRDIVSNAARDQDHYRTILDKTANHMRSLNVPTYVSNRVRYWLNFTWDLQKTFDEGEILCVLPLKSQTDIALSVHYTTLARVELFKNIDRSVLRDLVLKLRPILFLPGDYVCRKGDVGHEMYIVSKGRIEVLGANGAVLISLGEGSVFGEIAILNLEGFTRRTADVRSVGYSQLFQLTKTDLWETLKNYPEYQAVLKKKVQRILRKKRTQQNKNRKDAKARRRARMRSVQHTIELTDDEDEDYRPSTDKDRTETTVQMPPDTSMNIPTVDIVAADDDSHNAYNDESDDQIGNLFEDEDDDEVFGVASCIEVESIVKERPKTPKLFDAVMASIRPDSKVNHYFSRSQSIGSYQGQRSVSVDDEEVPVSEPQCAIKVEDTDPLM